MTARQTPKAHASTSAADAAPSRRSVFDRLMAAATEALSGRVVITEPKPSSDGRTPTTPDLTKRAMRLGNRNPEAVDRYLAKHQALASRIYSRGRDE